MLSIIVYPFMEDRPLGRAVFETLAILTLALVMRSITGRAVFIWAAAAVAAGLLVCCPSSMRSNRTPGSWSPVEWRTRSPYFVAWGGALLRYMFSDQRITRDGAVCGGRHVHGAGVGVRILIRGYPSAPADRVRGRGGR